MYIHIIISYVISCMYIYIYIYIYVYVNIVILCVVSPEGYNLALLGVGLGLGRQRIQCAARLEGLLETKRGITPNHWTCAATRQPQRLGADAVHGRPPGWGGAHPDAAAWTNYLSPNGYAHCMSLHRIDTTKHERLCYSVHAKSHLNTSKQIL